MSIIIVGEGLSALSVYQQLLSTGHEPILIGPRISKKVTHHKFSKTWEHVYSLHGRANVWGGWLDFPSHEIKDQSIMAEAKQVSRHFAPKLKKITPYLKAQGFKPKLQATKKTFNLKPKSLGNYTVQELIIEANRVTGLRAVHAKTGKEKLFPVDQIILCASPFHNVQILKNSKCDLKGLGLELGNHLITAGALLFEKKPFSFKNEVYKNYPDCVLELIGPKKLPKDFNEKKYKYFIQWALIYNLKKHKTSKIVFKPNLKPIFKLSLSEKKRYLEKNKKTQHYLKSLFPESQVVKLSTDFNIAVAAHEYGGLTKLVNHYGQFKKIKNLYCYDTSILNSAFSTFPTLASLSINRVNLKKAIQDNCFKN